MNTTIHKESALYQLISLFLGIILLLTGVYPHHLHAQIRDDVPLLKSISTVRSSNITILNFPEFHVKKEKDLIRLSKPTVLTDTLLQENPYHRSMTAIKVAQGPKIDGVLDDAVWQQVKFEADFIQRMPIPETPPTEITEFAIIYDDKNLYFGVRMFESEPDKIRITQMQRDGSLFNDDSFEIVLDTFHDHQGAYNLIINAVGSRIDAVIREDGRLRNRNWQGVWSVKTSMDEMGWYIEVAIPWQTLRFPKGDHIVMGGNFVRRIARKNEFDYWRFVPLYAGREGQERISEGGDITGFNGLKRGGHFELLPFITGGFQRDEETGFDNYTRWDTGIDLKVNLTSTLTADFTYNTDFAQVEADQEQINLTRFDLFFPEKRDFFLEGAETFTFGQGQGGSNPFYGHAANIQLFHSRRIGVDEESRQPVPIIGGARLNGKIGRYTLGLMSIQTEKTRIDTANGFRIVPETNHSAFRLKRNVFSRSSIGAMFLNKQETNGWYNRSFGFDSNIHVTETFSFFGAGAATFSPADSLKQNNHAVNGGFLYLSDLWRTYVSYLDIGRSFNPEMGYIRRTGIRRSEVSITFSPRPQKWTSVRQLFISATGMYQTDSHNRVLNKQTTATFIAEYENTSKLSFTVRQTFEYLEENFKIRPGLVIPQERYSNMTFLGSFNSSRTKPVSGSMSVNGGEFFSGTSYGGGLGVTVKAHPKIQTIMNYKYNEVKLPDGQFHTNNISLHLIYSFNTELFIKGFFQWVDDPLENNGRDQISANIILRYRYKPGSDFYLVFSQENLSDWGRHHQIKNRTVLAKLNFFLRK